MAQGRITEAQGSMSETQGRMFQAQGRIKGPEKNMRWSAKIFVAKQRFQNDRGNQRLRDILKAQG